MKPSPGIQPMVVCRATYGQDIWKSTIKKLRLGVSQKIKRINSISVKNIKGISDRTFNLELLPNKPTLLVAPNGSGKSSITAGFAAMNGRRIELPKDHCHKGDEALKPGITLSYILEDGAAVQKDASDDQNEITEMFDVYVINSQLVAKSKKLKIAGAPVVTSAIEVKPVVLIKEIPPRAEFNYSHAKAKENFGRNGKVLPSITALLREHKLTSRLDEIDFSKQGQVGVAKKLESFKHVVNALNGTAEDILGQIGAPQLERLVGIAYLADLVSLLGEAGAAHDREVKDWLAAIQIADLHAQDKAAFKKAVKFCGYQADKKYYEQAFAMLNSTWKSIAPKENKRSGLVIEFPKSNQISNGERDIICFVAHLMQAKLKFRKQQCILIIDEIFDYLDDANLVACQYYLTQMIKEMKDEGRQLFPWIMTHLSPGYFKNFCFSDQKVHYLQKATAADRSIEKIILKRSVSTIEDAIAKYFLHYHPEDKDLSAEFLALGLPDDLSSAQAFRNRVSEQLQRYLDDRNYDAIAVCCAVRILMEKCIYTELAEAHRPEFLTTHKTVEKFHFAAGKGVSVPEAFYMLGLIYNEAMHLRNSQDNVSPIVSRLNNLTIKHMIGSCKLLNN